MDGTGAGTAIMLAVAAVLWFLYLVPTWLRRREFLATERTATRLQQTIRVMAETAEVPESVRLAATSREAARQQRIARAERPAPLTDADAVRRRRMRRTRLGASLLMVATTIAALVQIWLIATTGITPGAIGVLAVSAAGGAVAIAVQRRLDARSMPRAASVRARTAVQVADAATDAPRSTWTPVELPRPMYLSRPAPERAATQTDLREALRVAAAEAEATLRAAQASPEVVPLRPTRSSKYAGMGVLGTDAVETPDLDEVLRRRRSAG